MKNGKRGKTGAAQLIGVYKIRPWKRGRTHIVTVPKEVVDRLSIRGGEKAEVYLSEDGRQIVYELVR